SSYAHPQRPKGAGVTILGPLIIKPAAVETHEIMEALSFVVEGVIQEGGVGGGEGPHASRLFAQFVEKRGENKGPGVVVGAISLGKVGHGQNGVLENSGGVGHLRQMFQFYLRQ